MNEKLKDWAGESVDRDSCPECSKHPDCFACVEGYCTALWILDGRVKRKKTEEEECHFYRPVQEVRESGVRAYRRLKEQDRMDLIIRHADTLIHTGAMDEEIQETNLQTESLERFQETDFSEQMDKAKAEELKDAVDTCLHRESGGS